MVFSHLIKKYFKTCIREYNQITSFSQDTLLFMKFHVKKEDNIVYLQIAIFHTYLIWTLYKFILVNILRYNIWISNTYVWILYRVFSFINLQITSDAWRCSQPLTTDESLSANKAKKLTKICISFHHMQTCLMIWTSGIFLAGLLS